MLNILWVWVCVCQCNAMYFYMLQMLQRFMELYVWMIWSEELTTLSIGACCWDLSRSCECQCVDVALRRQGACSYQRAMRIGLVRQSLLPIIALFLSIMQLSYSCTRAFTTIRPTPASFMAKMDDGQTWDLPQRYLSTQHRLSEPQLRIYKGAMLIKPRRGMVVPCGASRMVDLMVRRISRCWELWGLVRRTGYRT